MLPEERVLRHQCSLVPGHIGDRSAHERPRRGLDLREEPAVGTPQDGGSVPLDRAKDWCHHVMPSLHPARIPLD